VQKRTKFQIRSDAAKQRWVRDDRKEAFWRKHIAAQKQSGLSKRGYCLANNLSQSSFNAWSREIELREREKVAPLNVDELLTVAPSISPNPFVPLRLLAEAPSHPVTEPPSAPVRDSAHGNIEILVPGGAMIRITADCTAGLVAELFSALKS